MKNELLRHFLATIDYRFQKSIGNRSEMYGESSFGKGSRTPIEIIHHMTSVLHFALENTGNGDNKKQGDLQNLENGISQFRIVLADLDRIFSEQKIDLSLSKKLLQGPLSDVLTHIGQLAMMSRQFAKPIKGENYFASNIITE